MCGSRQGSRGTAVSVLRRARPRAVLPCADGGDGDVQPTRTGKERLGPKAGDEQRVDNCGVPLDRRGPKPRPDECDNKASQQMAMEREREHLVEVDQA
jgi:hypothetical protein